MLRSLMIALAWLAGLGLAVAEAQSPGAPEANQGAADDAMPTLTLPQDMTSPTLSGDVGSGAPSNAQLQQTEEVPYSVEGEETLDPGGN